MRRLLMSGLAAGCLSTGLAHGGEISERTTYFMVQGATFAELDRALDASGPLLSSGRRHVGSTDLIFTRDIEVENGKSGCRVVRTNLELKLVTNLPRWKTPVKADKTTKTKWAILQKDIAAHEAKHSAIAKTWLDRMNRDLLTLPAEATCDKMMSVAMRRYRGLVREHDEAQMDFDRAETRVFDARVEAKVAAATAKTAH